jgi:transposase
VISEIHGVSGRAMLEAIAAGERNPTTLAQLARGTMRGKIARLEEALDCAFVTGEHAAVLAMMLAAIDSYTARIQELTARIEVPCEPYLHQIAQLDAVPGTGVITAQDVIAEIGTGSRWRGLETEQTWPRTLGGTTGRETGGHEGPRP